MRTTWKAFVLLGLLSPALAGAAAKDPCKLPGIQFAHCPGATRNFYSALVAIHGWNGSCDSTFGKQSTSLYHILAPSKFYDWDCFQYESLQLSVQENARKLGEQLQSLKKAGYQQVLLATHSTGGILALQLLADKFAPPANPSSADDLPKIAGVLAWATPINGLRTYVSAGGLALVKAGFSPQTLPDLRADSEYLTTLKRRLKDYNRRYLSAPPLIQGKLDFRVWFLQGQGKDMVVQPFSEREAEKEGWYWPGRSHLIPTHEGHTHNVGQAGTRLAPRYPAELLNTRALVSLQVSPRFVDVFPENIDVVPKTLEARQTEVVNGLTYYADEEFKSAFTPSLAFLRRMYQGSFVRSREVDEKLVFGFLDLLQRKAANPNDDLVVFFDRFVREVLVGYDPTLGQDIQRLGHGNSHIAQAIIETADIIRQVVKEYLKSHPDSSRLLTGGPQAFNAQLIGFSAKFLDSPHGPAQYAALSMLDAAIAELPDEVVASSGVVPRLNAYYLKGGYRNLSAAAKSKVQSLYRNLGARGSALQTEVLAALNTKVPYLGAQEPSWVALADDKTIRSLLAEIEPRPNSRNREQLSFATGVVAKAGATGTDVAAALSAINVGKKLVASNPNPALRREQEALLREAAAQSDYGVVRRSYSPPL